MFELLLKKVKIVHYKDGWWNGKFQRWFLNGQMMENLTYKDQLPVGKWEYWFENGQLKNYLEIGKLKIVELPFGENQSQHVNDNPENRKKSVYSKDAMLERKIEIVEIIEL